MNNCAANNLTRCTRIGVTKPRCAETASWRMTIKVAGHVVTLLSCDFHHRTEVASLGKWSYIR